MAAICAAAKAFFTGRFSDDFQPAFSRRPEDRKSTRLNSSHGYISYAVFCLKKKKIKHTSEENGRDQGNTQFTPRQRHHRVEQIDAGWHPLSLLAMHVHIDREWVMTL